MIGSWCLTSVHQNFDSQSMSYQFASHSLRCHEALLNFKCTEQQQGYGRHAIGGKYYAILQYFKLIHRMFNQGSEKINKNLSSRKK